MRVKRWLALLISKKRLDGQMSYWLLLNLQPFLHKVTDHFPFLFCFVFFFVSKKKAYIKRGGRKLLKDIEYLSSSLHKQLQALSAQCYDVKTAASTKSTNWCSAFPLHAKSQLVFRMYCKGSRPIRAQQIISTQIWLNAKSSKIILRPFRYTDVCIILLTYN